MVNNNIDFSEYLFGPGEAAIESKDDNSLAKHTNEQLKDIIGDNPSIFITVNPDPKKEINRRHFKKLVNKWRLYIKKIYGEDAILYYRFERSEVAKLHIHGVIYNISSSFYPFEGTFTKIQKYIHKDVGRKKVKHSVCCDMSWAGNTQLVIDYIFKGKK